MKRIFYIDPQSYNNLAVYDFHLLSAVRGFKAVYFYNTKYQLPEMPCADCRAIFSYSDKRGIGKAASYIRSLLEIAVAAWKMRPSVVHIQWFRLFPADALFIAFLHIIGVKTVFTAHNIVPHNKKKKDVRHYAWYYRHIDAVIVHAECSKKEIEEKFSVPAGKISVIPHGLLPSSISEKEVIARSEVLSRQLHTAGKLVFSSLGFQNIYKGIDIISDVWCGNEELFCSNSCMLLVAGKVQNADLTRLAQCSNVVIVDRMVPDIDFEAYLHLTSVALLPYREISQSGVLLTALQRGVPVIVSDAGGLTDPLRYAKVGWCIGRASRETLSQTMLQLVGNPALVDAVAQDHEAFSKLREIYSWEHIGGRTAALYSRLT